MLPSLKKCRLPLAQHGRAEDITIERDRALYVSNNEDVGHHNLRAALWSASDIIFGSF
jgi:hypothetical protein